MVATSRGFTLLELMFSLTIIAILATLVVPGFNNIILDSQRTTDVNAFIRAVHVARNEAIKQSRPMTLCKTMDGAKCGRGESTWGDGWMILALKVGTLSESRILHYRPGREQKSVVGNRQKFTFHPFHKRQTNGNLTFCDRRGAAHARAVIVSYTGRPRVDSQRPGGRALVCPDG